MDIDKITDELLKNKNVFESLLSGIDKEAFLWKSMPEKWCLLEIICHLYDEEREDFRARTKHILDKRQEEFQKIEPSDWVTKRNYIAQDFSEMLKKFLAERESSLNWLKALDNADWSASHNHPEFGRMTAKMFLVNWLAHDYLHIRQITKLKYDYLQHSSGESLKYAGNW